MKGFILLEIVIATAIATGIMVVLFSALNQTMRYQTTLDDYVDYYTRAALIDNQIQKDFNGVFVPFQSWPKKEEVEKKVGPKAQDKNTDKKDIPQEKSAEQKKEEEEKEKIKKVFYASQEGEKLEFTFVTTNAMQVYWGNSLGKPKPRIVRVIYRLEPEKDKKDSFKLTRQESPELNYEKLKKEKNNQPRAFELINGIKEINLEFFGRVSKWQPVVDKSGTQSKEQELYKKEWEYQTFKKWDSDEMKTLSVFPDYIKMKLVLWDGAQKRNRTFDLSFADRPNITKDKVVWPERSKKEKKEIEDAPMPQQLAVQEMVEVTIIKDGKKNKYRAARSSGNILDMILN